MNIYLDASRLGIYPPLFTSPSGDSIYTYVYELVVYLFFSHIYIYFFNFLGDPALLHVKIRDCGLELSNVPIFFFFVTVISKCLALQESVRDAADLFLSLKYPPLLFICDTPCGFVRHMDCREPDVGAKLWGKFSGCFEVPDINKSPSEVRTFPMNRFYHTYFYN